MESIYNNYSSEQISIIKQSLRKSIFFLLLCVDPATKEEYSYVDIGKSFTSLLYKLTGFSSMFPKQKEFVIAASLLESAKRLCENTEYDFKEVRKLLLTAGAKINLIEEV